MAAVCHRIPSWNRLIIENGRNVPSGVQYSDHLDSGLDRPVEYQKILKSSDLPNAEFGKLGSFEPLPFAKFGLVANN